MQVIVFPRMRRERREYTSRGRKSKPLLFVFRQRVASAVPLHGFDVCGARGAVDGGGVVVLMVETAQGDAKEFFVAFLIGSVGFEGDGVFPHSRGDFQLTVARRGVIAARCGDFDGEAVAVLREGVDGDVVDGGAVGLGVVFGFDGIYRGAQHVGGDGEPAVPVIEDAAAHGSEHARLKEELCQIELRAVAGAAQEEQAQLAVRHGLFICLADVFKDIGVEVCVAAGKGAVELELPEGDERGKDIAAHIGVRGGADVLELPGFSRDKGAVDMGIRMPAAHAPDAAESLANLMLRADIFRSSAEIVLAPEGTQVVRDLGHALPHHAGFGLVDVSEFVRHAPAGVAVEFVGVAEHVHVIDMEARAEFIGEHVAVVDDATENVIAGVTVLIPAAEHLLQLDDAVIQSE